MTYISFLYCTCWLIMTYIHLIILPYLSNVTNCHVYPLWYCNIEVYHRCVSGVFAERGRSFVLPSRPARHGLPPLQGGSQCDGGQRFSRRFSCWRDLCPEVCADGRHK